MCTGHWERFTHAYKSSRNKFKLGPEAAPAVWTTRFLISFHAQKYKVQRYRVRSFKPQLFG